MMPVLIQHAEGDLQGWHPSLVLDFRAGEEIVVGVPLERGHEIAIEPGAQIRVQTAHRDGLRRFTSEVVRRRHVPSPCLYLSWPDQVERVQRREHVRVDVTVPIALHHPSEGDEQARTLRGQTANLSAGGARVQLAEALPAGRSVYAELHLPETGTVVCEAVVVNSGEEEPVRRAKRPWAAVQFLGGSASFQRDLTRFLFDVQREQIRKGLL